jgi:RNA polymerase sigma factor (TIGR02999 family)
MRRERPGQTMQTTALVNEAYIRLVDYKEICWQDRAHFFAVAAQLMRRILVEKARSRNYEKRGGGNFRKVSLDEAADLSGGPTADIVAIDDALKNLAAIDPRKSQIVELKFFGGLSIEETAEVMSISTATVERELRSAKAWLFRAISKEEEDGS